MYMIIEEWQILWVLGESAFCNDQYYMTKLPQNYFYISLIILSTHRFPLAGTSCWNVAHYQSHCFDLLYQPLLADFVPFFSCQKLLLKREEGRATYSSEHKISWQLWNSIRNHTHTYCNTTSRGERWTTDRSGRFSCRSASFLGCLQGTAAGSPFRTWPRPPHRCRRSGRMGPRTTHPRSCCTGSS